MQARAVLSGELLPDVKVRRILLRQHENVLARFNEQILCRNSKSITGRRDDRQVVFCGIK